MLTYGEGKKQPKWAFEGFKKGCEVGVRFELKLWSILRDGSAEGTARIETIKYKADHM